MPGTRVTNAIVCPCTLFGQTLEKAGFFSMEAIFFCLSVLKAFPSTHKVSHLPLSSPLTMFTHHFQVPSKSLPLIYLPIVKLVSHFPVHLRFLSHPTFHSTYEACHNFHVSQKTCSPLSDPDHASAYDRSGF